MTQEQSSSDSPTWNIHILVAFQRRTPLRHRVAWNFSAARAREHVREQRLFRSSYASDSAFSVEEAVGDTDDILGVAFDLI